MKSPEKYVFIWPNGNIAHIIAESVLHASMYCSKIYGFVDTAYIIRHSISKKDFDEPNIIILDGIMPCDVITEHFHSLIEIFSHTKLK